MSPVTRAILAGVIATVAVLLIAIVVSDPNATTVVLAIAIGLAVALSTWYQRRR